MKLFENILYSKNAGAVGAGDLYLPENFSENTRLALCIHGGGWNSMSRERMHEIATFLCRDLGLAVYNIDYRLAREAAWPAGGNDCLEAAWFLLDGKIPQIQRNGQKILIIGASSGGHYALMTGLRLPPERVSGIISISGINFVKEDFAFSPGRYLSLFGHAPSREELDLIDPIKFLKPDSPPVLCTHDINDDVVPCQCTRSFAAAAAAAGVDCTCCYTRREASGASHRIFREGSTRLHADLEKEITKFVCKNVIGYIPEPQAQKSDIEISAFYYPGTEQMAEWDQVDETKPEIKPLLGWYDESNPETVDWQIKWAVEHGISSFCVDWYWNQGVRRLEHWVQAFYKARFRKYLKWYIMWANHNEIGAHSAEDQRKVTRFWIENYFRTPEYYTIEGHPVVVIWSYNNLDRDFRQKALAQGEKLSEGAGVRRALEISNEEMRKAGLPEIHFVNMYNSSTYDPVLVRAARSAGFKDQMVYNVDLRSFQFAPEAAQAQDTGRNFNYDCVLAGAPGWWQQSSGKEVDFPLIPTVSTGWNDQPRSFENARVVYGRTPEKYRNHCAACKEFCLKNGRKKIIIAPLNEWQEGSYIEPNEEYGFGMYNAIRDTFCTMPPEGFPTDLSPGDTGRGPYDFPPMEHPAKTLWDFTSDVQGWYRNPFGTAHIQIVDGALHFVRSGGNRAAIRTRITPFPAEKFTKFKVMMKTLRNVNVPVPPDFHEMVRLYWGTKEYPLVAENLHIRCENSVAVAALPDGEWHEYTLDLSSNPLWKGAINELWFDPPQLQFTAIDIRWMRMEV